jgi:hypothetical protein
MHVYTNRPTQMLTIITTFTAILRDNETLIVHRNVKEIE